MIRIICIHLEKQPFQIYLPPGFGKWEELEFIDRLRKKWPDLEIHSFEREL